MKLKDRLLTVFLLFAAFLFVASVINTSKKIKLVNKEVESRQEQLTKLRDEESALKEKLDEIISEEYFEKQIRNQLNLSKENEIVLILPDDETLRKLVPNDVSEEASFPVPNWRKWIQLFGVSI